MEITKQIHPKSEQVFALANAFYELEKTCPNGIVDMQELSSPYLGLSCGAPACHAGWFYVWCIDNKLEHLGKEGFTFFDQGAFALHRFLGFSHKDDDREFEDYDLSQWAKNNPDIWGNQDGGFMFSASSSFGDPPITLKTIADHWHKVGERLQELERQGKSSIDTWIDEFKKTLPEITDKQILVKK